MRKTVAWALAGWWWAGGALAADLLDVYRDALAYDAQFAAAKAQLDATLERLPQSRAGLLPNVGLSANANWNDADSNTTGKRTYSSDAYSVQLTQPLFRWQNMVVYNQAKLQIVQAEAVYANARQDLILRVSQAYFDVLVALENVIVLESQKTATAEQLEAAKKNFEVGTATITDTHEAQARFDLVTAQEIAARNDLEVKRQALRQLIGKVPDTLKALRPDVEIQRPQPDDMQKWVEAAEQTSYAVLVQQAALDIATREVERARAGHYPTVDLVASHGRSSSGSSFVVGTDVTTNTIGVQLAIPLYQGGATVSREREAFALKDKAQQDLENARRTGALAARQAYLGVTSGMAQTRALDQALVSSQSALESNKLGYEVGVRINIDVLNAQQQVSATRRDLAKSRYDTLLAQLRLKAAAGSLGEPDVGAINALLK